MMLRQQSQAKRQERRETRKQMTPKRADEAQKPLDNIHVGKLQNLQVLPTDNSEDSVSETGSTKTKRQMKEEEIKEK